MAEVFSSSAAEALRDKLVKDYFLSVLASELDNEEKYQRFVDFFEREEEIRGEVLESYPLKSSQQTPGQGKSLGTIVNEVSRKLKIWKPEHVLTQTINSVEQALEWMKRTQKPDGRFSNKPGGDIVFWETAYSSLCLAAAAALRPSPLAEGKLEGMFELTVQWLDKNADGWAFNKYPEDELIPSYDVALAVLCFYKLGPERFTGELAHRIPGALARLITSRSPEGGWASRPWEPEEPERKRHLLADNESEVGATSLVIRALLETRNPAYHNQISEAIQWLLGCQDPEGSWSNVFTTGGPDIPKTCDAVQALLATQEAGWPEGRLKSALNRAVAWLQSQEQAIFQHGKVMGWQWDVIPTEIDSKAFSKIVEALEVRSPDDIAVLREVYKENPDRGEQGTFLLSEDTDRIKRERAKEIFIDIAWSLDFTSTCLTIEALVGAGEASLPLLSSSVEWLIRNQYKKESDGNRDEMWGWNTPRITLSLIRFCKRLEPFLDEEKSDDRP
jgi:hypothetical protein